jgi:hypothetical protein
VADGTTDKDFVHAEPHLVAAATRDTARLLAESLYAWSQSDPQPVKNLGRYAARGTLRCADSRLSSSLARMLNVGA